MARVRNTGVPLDVLKEVGSLAGPYSSIKTQLATTMCTMNTLPGGRAPGWAQGGGCAALGYRFLAAPVHYIWKSLCTIWNDGDTNSAMPLDIPKEVVQRLCSRVLAVLVQIGLQALVEPSSGVQIHH